MSEKSQKSSQEKVKSQDNPYCRFCNSDSVPSSHQNNTDSQLLLNQKLSKHDDYSQLDLDKHALIPQDSQALKITRIQALKLQQHDLEKALLITTQSMISRIDAIKQEVKRLQTKQSIQEEKVHTAELNKNSIVLRPIVEQEKVDINNLKTKPIQKRTKKDEKQNKSQQICQRFRNAEEDGEKVTQEMLAEEFSCGVPFVIRSLDEARLITIKSRTVRK